MNDSAYLIFDKNGLRRLVKGRQSKYARPNRPALGAGEFAVYVTVNVPDAVFRPAALPEATITIPEHAVIAPSVVVQVESIPPGVADETNPVTSETVSNSRGGT